MEGVAKYILDTSCFTQAFRTYYSFEIAPSFWNFIDKKFGEGIIVTNEKVYKEIEKGKDELFEWMKNGNVKNRLLNTKTNNGVLTNYAYLMQWSEGTEYKTTAKQEFAQYSNADAWVISCALEFDLQIVSQEVSAPESKRRIKIPDVCTEFSINHLDTFSFLKEIGFRM